VNPPLILISNGERREDPIGALADAIGAAGGSRVTKGRPRR
jgi:hypothetical protein